MTGAGGLARSPNVFDLSLDESSFSTNIEGVASESVSSAGTCVWSSDEVMKVVGKGASFQYTTLDESNPLPSTDKVKAGPKD